MKTPQTNLPTPLDELGLKDIIQAVIKAKWVVIICLFLSILVALLHGFTVKPVYESIALIQIGEIPKLPGFALNSGTSVTLPLEDPVKLSRRLKITKRLFSVTVDKVDKVPTNILTIINRAHNPIAAQSYLKKITADLVKQHDTLLLQAVKVRKDGLNSLQSQINSIQIQLDSCEKQLARASATDSLRTWLTMEKMRLIESQAALAGRLPEQELLLSEVYVKPTVILEEPSLPRKSIEPNWPLYLELAIFFGIIFGVMAAVFLERILVRKGQKIPAQIKSEN